MSDGAVRDRGATGDETRTPAVCRVLVVGATPLCTWLRDQLEHDGHDVRAVPRAEDLHVTEPHGPDAAAAAVVDLPTRPDPDRLAGIDVVIVADSAAGIRLCRLLRRNVQTVPILLVGSGATGRDRAAGLDAGADDYLTEPIDTDELRARVQGLQVLARRRHRPRHE
ncbi:response regulator [Pseudonocardia sp. GCM10023141]|uniref:response regulator n=1 Tax=Pseudonocardia sp. GCM10023141 TaxID=3252653 RepID=UPI0036183FD1